MSFQAAAITGKIGLDEAPAVRALKNVGKEAGSLKATVEQEMGAAGASGGKAFFKGLNSEFGKKSILGQSLKLAAGGGAIAGIGLAVAKFQELAGSVEDLATAFRKGDQSASEIWGGFLRGVPILGGMVKGFDSLREAVTGERAAMEQEAAYVKASEESWKGHVEVIERGKKAAGEWHDIIVKLREDFRILTGGPSAAADVSFENQMGGLKAKYEGSLDEQIKAKEPLDAAIKRRDELRENVRTAEIAFKQQDGPSRDIVAYPKAKAELEAANNALKDQSAAVVQMQTHYEDLKKVAEDAEKTFTDARGQAITNESERLAQIAAKAIRDNPFMLGTGEVGPVGGYTGEAVKGGDVLSDLIKGNKERDKIMGDARAESDARTQHLPSARIQAEDATLGRIVTDADMPAKTVEQTTKTAVNTAKLVDLMAKLVTQNQQGPSAFGPTIDTVGLD